MSSSEKNSSSQQLPPINSPAVKALGAFHQIAVIADSSLDRKEILQTSVEFLLEILEEQTGGVCLLNQDKLEWELASPSSGGALERLVSSAEGRRFLNQVVSGSGASILAGKEALSFLGRFKSLIALPVRSPQELFGAMVIVSPKEGRFASEEAKLLESTGHFLGVCLQNKRLLSKLRKSEVTYRALVENVDEILLQVDASGCFTFLSGKIFDSIGYKPQELLGCNFQQLIHPEDIGIPEAAFEDSMRGGSGATSGSYRVKHKGGGYRWHFTSYSPLRDAAGEIIGGVGIARDVTAEMETREKLDLSETRLQEIFETMQEGIVVTDLKGKIVDLNHIACDALGLKPEETQGQSFYNFVSPEDADKIEQSRVAVLRYGRISNREFTFITKKGIRFPAEMNISLLRGQSGEPLGFIWVGRDISDRREWERKLKESEERYRNIFNTFPASVILIDLQGRVVDVNEWHLKQFESPGTSRESYLGKDFLSYPPNVKAALNKRLSELLKGKSFETRNVTIPFADAGDKRVFDVIGVPRFSLEGEVAGGLLVYLDVSQRRELEKKSIEAKRLEAVRDLAGAIAHEFSQPIQGLLLLGEMSTLGEVNHKHWEQVVELTERLSDLVLRLKHITSVKTKAYLRDRILDFYGSLKGPKSEHPKRVLVIDDETIIREALGEMLQKLGFEVATAAGGREAVSWLETGEFGLVICDIYMPDLDGFGVFEVVQKRWPELPFVFVTGYSVPIEREKVISQAAGILEKPVKMEHISAMVERFWPKVRT
ncbi:MAG: PAS domain S-box protein [Candidatus Zixiibacteriota bacterium]